MIELELKLTPQKVDKYWEPIMMSFRLSDDDTFYPSGIVHIDTFWDGGKNTEAYDLLNTGNEVVLNMSLKIISHEKLEVK